MATPRSLIRALYQHWDSIEHLVRLSRETPSFDRGQILAVLNQHQPSDSDEKAMESLQLLVNADLLQPLPRSQSFELHPLVTDFVRNLTHDHDLGLSEVLRARIEAIQEGTSRLAASMQTGDRDERRRAATQLSGLFRQISQQLDQDHHAIQRIAEAAKRNTDSRPALRRYQEVIEAFDQYVQPMAEMMDTSANGIFFRHLEHAEKVLDDAANRLSIEGGLYTQQLTMQQVAYQAKALRSHGRTTLKSCTATLLPLREDLRSHSSLASAVALLLGEIRSHGANRVLRGETLPVWQRDRPQRLALGGEVREYMAEARVFEPVEVTFPDNLPVAETPVLEHVDDAAIVSHLQSELPVTDLLRWLCAHYGHLQDSTLMRLYSTFICSENLDVTTGNDRSSIDLNTIRVHFYPHGASRHD